MINGALVGEGNDGKIKEPLSEKQQWLVDHLDKYVVQSKVKDEAILYEKDNIKYYCELEVSVNCLKLILLGLTADNPSDAEQATKPVSYSKNLKKIVTNLVEDVARHAIVIEYSPLGSKLQKGKDEPPRNRTQALGVIDRERFTTITADSELHFISPFEDEGGELCKPAIRLIQSSLKRNVKRRKAKPRYPVYMWLLAGSNYKRIIPPKHATDFYYRLLEGRVGYPSNYLGACINDLAAQGIIEVAGKRLIIGHEGAELVSRILSRDIGTGVITWKVRVGHKKVKT